MQDLKSTNKKIEEPAEFSLNDINDFIASTDEQYNDTDSIDEIEA